jgi:probable HAF family extracellular repeat protein
MTWFLPAGRRVRLVVAGAAVLLGAAPLTPALAAPDAAGVPIAAYRVVDLGTLPGGSFSAALAVNERVEVAGQSDGRAVMWRGGRIIDLGTPAGTGSVALDISELGEVVGYRQVGDGFRAFRWQAGELVDLVPLPGDTSSFALAVNDRGEVVGFGDPSSRPVRWRPDGTAVDLSATTKLLRVDDLDNNGRLAGEFSPDGANTIPVLVQGSRATVLSNRSGATSGINDRAEVTGFFFDGSRGSFTWAGGQLTEIPKLPGSGAMQAQAINNRGSVVGFSDVAGGFLWDGTTLQLLPGLAGNPTAAQDINDRGQIAGSSGGAPPNPNPHAVLLLPM